MSRWLAAFRARHALHSDASFIAARKPENPEKGENPEKWPTGERASLDIRDIRPIRNIGPGKTPNGTSVAWLVQAGEDALAALAGPALRPVLQVGEVDHDDAERAALVDHYIAPEAVPPTGPAPVYCFPCGKLVPGDCRTWSEARGWCCAACLKPPSVLSGAG